jgi:hypothetical protein
MVRTGVVRAGQVEILAGINPGDKVVTSAGATLQNGDKVTN